MPPASIAKCAKSCARVALRRSGTDKSPQSKRARLRSGPHPSVWCKLCGRSSNSTGTFLRGWRKPWKKRRTFIHSIRICRMPTTNSSTFSGKSAGNGRNKSRGLTRLVSVGRHRRRNGYCGENPKQKWFLPRVDLGAQISRTACDAAIWPSGRFRVTETSMVLE